MINFFSADKNNLPLQVKINTKEIEDLKASVKMVFTGDYDRERPYGRFDVVLYNGSSYICVVAEDATIIGQTPTQDGTYWKMLCKGGVDGTDGTTIGYANVDITDATTTIAKSDIPNQTLKPLDAVIGANFGFAVVTIVSTNNYTVQYIGSLVGPQGEPGQDGQTPTIEIGVNGHWYINGVDTGVDATGPQGPAGSYTAGEGIDITSDTITNKGRLKGTSAPTTATVGYVGQEYYNTNTGDIYTCKAVIDNGDDTYSYTWEISGGKPILDSKMENPMTSAGDLIYGGPNGDPTALPIGQPGQIPAVNPSGTGFEFVNQASGGSQLYDHIITVGYEQTSSYSGSVKIRITNNSSTPFTTGTLKQFLINNGYTSNLSMYPTTCDVRLVSNVPGFSAGIFCENNNIKTRITTLTINFSASTISRSGVEINICVVTSDTVIAL